MKIFLNFVPKILHKYKFLFAFITLLSAALDSSQNMDIDREITNFLKRHQIMVNPDQITPILFDIFSRTPNQNFAKGISIVDLGSGEGNLTLALLNTLKKFRNHGFCDIPININFFEIDQKKINKCNYNMGKESGFFPKLSWEQMGGIEGDGWERFKNNTKEQKDSILFILSNPPYLINTPEKRIL